MNKSQNKLLNELNEIKSWLDEQRIKIKSTHPDGRTDSLLNEKVVTAALCNNFDNISAKPDNRSFGDVYITIDDVIYPVNIKLTMGNSNDNLVGICSIVPYICYGRTKGLTNKSLVKMINTQSFTTVDMDYGFISINKSTGKCNVSTMITMENYVVNPAQSQFQGNFDKIKTDTNKSFEDGREYILNMYKWWLRKRAEPYNLLDNKTIFGISYE